MQYRKDKHGEPLSILGYGCMRFSRRGGGVDLAKTEAEIMAAYRGGVNYFDTAYIYPGSEAALGEILERNAIRDKVRVATKLPQYLVRSAASLDKYFKEELSRLRTDYVDYYLMHHLTDIAQWERLKGVGILDWIAGKKASGAIRNIGFSYHGNTDNFLKILEDYDWDFCQIQYNYMDETSQAGVAGLKAAAARGIPVVIMEPLRGGKLANGLPVAAEKLIASSPRGWSPAEWAFRWLWDQSEVTVVLSGMNSLGMVEENVRTASDSAAGAFTGEDREFLKRITGFIREKEKVGCTGCRYCMPCPKDVDIPGIFSCYNTMFTESAMSGRMQYVQTVALAAKPSFASQCVRCGKCEQHCPQSIPIREKIIEAERKLLPWPMKGFVKLLRRFMLRK